VAGEPTERRDVGGLGYARDDWDRHWIEYAVSSADNPAQEFRRRLVLRLLDGVDHSSRVLDIGSGTGELAAAIRGAHPDAAVLGLELSASGIDLARRKAPHASFLQVDLARKAAPPREYEGWATHAVCSEVLEHVDDPRGVLANCVPYLAAGCRVVVTVPGGPMTAYDRHIGHRRHFTRDELARVLREAGFEVDKATGAGFPVFNVYRLLMRALGTRLIAVAGESSTMSRVAMRIFAVGFRLNGQLSPLGWQRVAIGRLR
jgi:SAM-dependent methyltransferase